MPGTYMNLKDNIYLAICSAEEQAYTLGAAIAECRKKLDSLDESIRDIRKMRQEMKALDEVSK